MRVTFWGTRGSLAKPGPATVRYGGNTSCVCVESDSGTLLLIDCGTGAHGLGQDLLRREQQPLRGHILISHTHWDHIQGLPFFAPLFVPGNEWDVYGPRGLGESLRDTLAGQMSYTYFPVALDALGAEVKYHNLVEGSFEIGDIHGEARYLNHPALTLGYRLEVDGATMVYACDHEPHARELASGGGDVRGEDREHVEFLRDADLVIHDAQYTPAEYPEKVGWGHSTPDYAVHVCKLAGVRRLALTHHDPMRSDDELERIFQTRIEDGLEIFAAAEGQTIELRSDAPAPTRAANPDRVAERAEAPASDHAVLLGLPDSPEAETIASAAHAEEIEVLKGADPLEVIQGYGKLRPSMVILPHDDEGLGTARSVRAFCDAHALDAPILLVGDTAGTEAAVTDWLLTPFSEEYARTRLRAWLFRVECRWTPAPKPDEELDRLASLQALGLLDSPPEERFDRLTRIAARSFGVPMAWVTLMDADRQWFKARVGLEEPETPRDQSFCSHAILSREPLVVPDAHLDSRFADSPLVVGPPYVRFYAGCPITVEGRYRVGTLCIADVKPRHLSEDEIRLLRDLADVVETELAQSPTKAEGGGADAPPPS